MKFQNYMRDTHSVFVKGANEGFLLFLFEDTTEVVGTWGEAECLRLCEVYLISPRMMRFKGNRILELFFFFFLSSESEHRTYDK